MTAPEPSRHLPAWNDLPSDVRSAMCRAAEAYDEVWGGDSALAVYNVLREQLPPVTFPLFERAPTVQREPNTAPALDGVVGRHTPKPWVVGRRADGSAWISRGNPALGAHNQADFAGTEEDARLTCAAPDLLEALKSIEATVSTGHAPNWQRVRNVIASAEVRPRHDAGLLGRVELAIASHLFSENAMRAEQPLVAQLQSAALAAIEAVRVSEGERR
ncbi:hypothetical protein ACLBXM_18955 [Xanthobacteraceae bacterium A53D]